MQMLTNSSDFNESNMTFIGVVKEVRFYKNPVVENGLLYAKFREYTFRTKFLKLPSENDTKFIEARAKAKREIYLMHYSGSVMMMGPAFLAVGGGSSQADFRRFMEAMKLTAHPGIKELRNE